MDNKSPNVLGLEIDVRLMMLMTLSKISTRLAVYARMS